MIRRYGFGTVLFTGLVACGLLQNAADAQQSSSSAWKVGTPIVSYYMGPTVTDAMARQMADGGFNLVVCNSMEELDNAQRYGLRAQFPGHWSYLPTQQPELDAVIDQVRNHPAFYAYTVRDEPNVSDFADVARVVGRLRERDPSHLAMVNLFPNTASNAYLGTTGGDLVTSYNSYLNQYVATVQPSLLSYDHYPFKPTSDSGEYLHNLAMVRSTAQQAGVPFMQIVQACSWDASMARVPTGDEMRFQVYSTLAYGAQGISYYLYTYPGHVGGMALPDGTPTELYTAVTPLNHEFVKIASQTQGLKCIGDYIEGYSTTRKWSWSQFRYVTTFHGPPGTITLPSDSPFNISGISNDMDYNEGDAVKGVLLGLFDKDGTTLADATFALVQNLDYTLSKTYTVTGTENLSIFDATTGVWTAVGSNQATLHLLPGGGILVGLTSAVPVPEPSVLAMLGVGAATLLAFFRRKCHFQLQRRF
jgi:hypothetical protein